MNSPESTLYGATLHVNEYCWKPQDFSRALSEAIDRGLACIGGQFQFQLPGGTCELYWLNADSTPRRSSESWSTYVMRSASEVKARFDNMLQSTDFLAEADCFEFLREQKAKGVSVLDALWFVAYFEPDTKPT
jgi:hypothetical protein